MLSRALSASEFSPLYTSGRGKSSFLRETTTVVTAAGEVRLNFYRMNFSRAPAGKFLLSFSALKRIMKIAMTRGCPRGSCCGSGEVFFGRRLYAGRFEIELREMNEALIFYVMADFLFSF